MDKTTFAISIVTNIVAAIIIWLCKRLMRRAKNLLVNGTISAKVRQIFTPRRITILGSLVAALVNLWILVRMIFRDSFFGRWELLLAITVSLLIAYWINKIVVMSGSKTEQKLSQAEDRLATLEAATRARSLSPEQRELLLRRLRGTPAGTFDLRIGAAGSEVADFANDLAVVLTEAGWVLRSTGVTLSGRGPRGTGIIVHPQPTTLRAAVLQTALNEIGFTTPIEINSDYSPDSVTLRIGDKPQISD